MGVVGILLPLSVACSFLLGGSWAGPIDPRLNAPHTLRNAANHVTGNSPSPDPTLYARGAIIAPTSPVIGPRSSASSSTSMWTITAIVGIILLICLLLVVLVMVRRSKRHQKAGSDEERGFGQHLGAQPDLVPPARSYDGVTGSHSSPVKDMVEDTTSQISRKHPPPPLLIVSSPEAVIQRPERIPVPRLPVLPHSPRATGLPPSPRLIGLPPSPRLPISPRNQQHIEDPSNSFNFAASPSLQNRLINTSGKLSANNIPSMEVPLSAGGLERMMTQMETEMKHDN